MLKLLICALLLSIAAPLTLADQIYKHVDEDGNVTYSDEPQHQEAQKIELKPINTAPAIEIKPTEAPKQVVLEAEPDIKYDLRIATPKPEQRFGPKDKMLSVVMLTNHQLEENHFFQVYLDGQAYEGSTKSNNVNIQLNLPLRGQHTLYAAIVDGAGVHLEQCPPVTFFVIRPKATPRVTPY